MPARFTRPTPKWPSKTYTRRQEGVSIWVVPAEDITASSPDDKDVLFDPANDKVYRHATFYKLPDEVNNM